MLWISFFAAVLTSSAGSIGVILFVSSVSFAATSASVVVASTAFLAAAKASITFALAASFSSFTEPSTASIAASWSFAAFSKSNLAFSFSNNTNLALISAWFFLSATGTLSCSSFKICLAVASWSFIAFQLSGV